MTKIIKNQLDIKLGQFIQEELDVLLIKIKNRKSTDLHKIPPEIWKTKKFDVLLLPYCNAVITRAQQKTTKDCILPFPNEGDLGIAKNNRGITLTSIEATIYIMLCYSTASNQKLRKFFERIKMVFGETDQQHRTFWQSVES